MYYLTFQEYSGSGNSDGIFFRDWKAFESLEEAEKAKKEMEESGFYIDIAGPLIKY